jgi:hypothetical protein
MTKSSPPKVLVKKARNTHLRTAPKVAAEKVSDVHRKSAPKVAARKATDPHVETAPKDAGDTHRSVAPKVAPAKTSNGHPKIAPRLLPEDKAALKGVSPKAGNGHAKTALKVTSEKSGDAQPKAAPKSATEKSEDAHRKTATKVAATTRFEEFRDTQVPDSMRALAEKNVAQARDLYERSKNVFQAVLESWEKSLAGTVALNRKIIDMAEHNIAASFDLATSLAGAKNLAEAVELQTAYWRKQFRDGSAQAEQVRALSIKVSADIAQPVKAQLKGMC